MGKLRRLRSRFISSIGAVKRSVLRRQSQSNSTASNPTTLTRLGSLDSAVPSRTTSSGRRAQKRKIQVRLQAQGDETQRSFQLHWNEARRIYSEPVHVTQGLSREEEARSGTGTTVTDSCRIAAADQRSGSLCGAAQDGSQLSDEEDYDDVFLQSWEDTGNDQSTL